MFEIWYVVREKKADDSGSVHDLLDLIDEAHRLGLRVLMDIVHAHASTNEGEGLNRFDGSENGGYFKPHLHPEWGTWVRTCDLAEKEVDFSTTATLKCFGFSCEAAISA